MCGAVVWNGKIEMSDEAQMLIVPINIRGGCFEQKKSNI